MPIFVVTYQLTRRETWEIEAESREEAEENFLDGTVVFATEESGEVIAITEKHDLRDVAFDALEELTSWNETYPEDEGTAEAVQRLRAALGCDE